MLLAQALLHAHSCTFPWETPKCFFGIITGCSSVGGIPRHSSHLYKFLERFLQDTVRIVASESPGTPRNPPESP